MYMLILFCVGVIDPEQALFDYGAGETSEGFFIPPQITSSTPTFADAATEAAIRNACAGTALQDACVFDVAITNSIFSVQ